MKIFTAILTIFALLLLVSCDPYLNVLVLPKEKNGNYFIAKGYYHDWTGQTGTITFHDKNNNIVTTCQGRRTLTKRGAACNKEYTSLFRCSDGRIVEFNYVKVTCTESYGTACDNAGQTYEIFAGVSDEFMKEKISEYEKE
ncbi:MAG: hypothetical protein HY809_05600 [Nitrospirae bacterium]|nr:hypothetical protein [Nitrospirota bacterium]